MFHLKFRWILILVYLDRNNNFQIWDFDSNRSILKLKRKSIKCTPPYTHVGWTLISSSKRKHTWTTWWSCDGHEIDTAGDSQYVFIDKYRTIEVGQNFKIFVKNSTIWIATNDTISLVNGERESSLDEARDPRTELQHPEFRRDDESEVRLSWIK